jgi:PAS domain S-box-containing protein
LSPLPGASLVLQRQPSWRVMPRVVDALRMWAPLMLLLAVLMGLLYRSGYESVRSNIAGQQAAAVHEASLAMASYMGWVQRDVVLLGRLGRHIEAQGAGTGDWRVVEQAFVDLMSTRKDVYAQARYIDERGMELVRVDSVHDQVVVVPADQLQDKSDRYYFQQGIKLPAGQVYLSRFDLNVERGEIEIPYNPMVRFSTKLQDASSHERGLVVLNVRARPLIDLIKGMQLPEGAELWLLNRDGGWMIGPTPADEWRFLDPRADNARLGDQHPELWSAIQSGESDLGGLHSVSGGLLSSRAFSPRERLSIPGIDLRPQAEMTWYLASWLPDSALPVHLKPLRQRALAAFAALASLFFAIAFYGSHLLFRRRQAQEFQAKSEAHTRQLLESAPDAIVATDTTGTVVFCNEHAQLMFGYTRDELLGKNVESLIPVRFRKPHVEHVSRYARALPGRHEMARGRALSAMHRDGHEFPAIIVLNKIEGPLGQRVIATIQDVTEMRAMQAAMAQANRQLQISNKDLESFSYSVAHDLRSPLRVLNGFSQILLTEYGEKFDEQCHGYLKRICAASDHMGSILNGMLELSRIGRSELAVEDLDIGALAHEITELLREEHPARSVAVQIEPGMKAKGDPGLIKIVLLNLLSNAWKFTSRSPNARIEMGTQRTADGRSEFFVRDNGAGFDMAYAKKLFDAFERLHKAEDFPGTGIGLATVSRVIEKHGGKIRAEAGVGQGATFYFSLGGAALA